MRVSKALLSSEDQTWNTPRWYIERAVRALGPVGFDPCSNPFSVVGACTEYMLERGQDGLSLPWLGLGWGHLNPPFGRVIGRWMRRAAATQRQGGEVLALVPARIDTLWWQSAMTVAAVGILWRGRFTYRLRGVQHGNAPFPTSLLYFGPRARDVVAEFCDSGIVVPGWWRG